MASMTAPEFAPYLQGAAEEYAAASVLTAVTPLRGQLADLTGRLQSTSMQLLQAQAQIAALSVAEPPPLPAGWTKTAFLDDFTGTRPDSLKWNVRNNDYSANELSALTNRPANVVLDGKTLTLRAQRELYTIGAAARNYTSGYLDTIGRDSWQYGRFEIRAKLPKTKGTWPAFWLRGAKGLGELDILESVGGTGKTVQTVHQSTNGDQAKKGHEDSSVADLTAWHVYAAEREAGVIRWFIDDRLVFTVTAAEAPWLDATFNEPMNIRLNLQVGGSMPNWYKQPVDATTTLPADFVVDYVRVLAR